MTIATFPTTVTARQIQRDYKSIFSEAKKSANPIVVISNNMPQAAIISISEMQKYLDYKSKAQLWQTINALQTKNRYNKPVETQKVIDLAVEEARKKVYEETFGSSR